MERYTNIGLFININESYWLIETEMIDELEREVMAVSGSLDILSNIRNTGPFLCIFLPPTASLHLSYCIRIHPIYFENNIAVIIKMYSEYEGTVGIKLHEI